MPAAHANGRSAQPSLPGVPRIAGLACRPWPAGAARAAVVFLVKLEADGSVDRQDMLDVAGEQRNAGDLSHGAFVPAGRPISMTPGEW